MPLPESMALTHLLCLHVTLLRMRLHYHLQYDPHPLLGLLDWHPHRLLERRVSPHGNPAAALVVVMRFQPGPPGHHPSHCARHLVRRRLPRCSPRSFRG